MCINYIIYCQFRLGSSDIFFSDTLFQIDLATFTTLNDQDLKEIGINTLGARKKMLVAIAGMRCVHT